MSSPKAPHLHSAVGALPFFKTHVVLQHPESAKRVLVTSRNNRKHRHRLHNQPSGQARHEPAFWRKVLRTFIVVEYGNIAWWVAILFTIGSVVWCINGIILFVPFVNPGLAMDPDGGGWTAWIGATIFEFGALLALIEAWNVNHEQYFGWAMSMWIKPHDVEQGQEKPNVSPQPTKTENQTKTDNTKWQWYSSDRKYWHDIGFVAGVIQYFAATVFWIAGWTGLPVIFNAIESDTRLTAGVFWTPQVIGGSGFVISGLMYMVENQTAWYRPALTSLGWHIGFWNMLGGLGFTLCPAFGYSSQHWTLYESALSTFWGGWAFLIGSYLQLYESVNPTEPTAVENDEKDNKAEDAEDADASEDA